MLRTAATDAVSREITKNCVEKCAANITNPALRKAYYNICSNNRRKIMESGLQLSSGDHVPASPNINAHLLIIPEKQYPAEVLDNMMRFRAQIKRELSDVGIDIETGPLELHSTVIGVIPTRGSDTLDPETLIATGKSTFNKGNELPGYIVDLCDESYLDRARALIGGACSRLTPFEEELAGVIPTDNAVIGCGLDRGATNLARIFLTNILGHEGMMMMPKMPDILHTVLERYKESVKDSRRLNDFFSVMDRHRHHDFGRVKIDRAYLVREKVSIAREFEFLDEFRFGR